MNETIVTILVLFFVAMCVLLSVLFILTILSMPVCTCQIEKEEEDEESKTLWSGRALDHLDDYLWHLREELEEKAREVGEKDRKDGKLLITVDHMKKAISS